MKGEANGATYDLPLTAGQADHLLRLVSIGKLTVAENRQWGWLPKLAVDRTFMEQQLKALRGAPSLESELLALGTWVVEQESGKR